MNNSSKDEIMFFECENCGKTTYLIGTYPLCYKCYNKTKKKSSEDDTDLFHASIAFILILYFLLMFLAGVEWYYALLLLLATPLFGLLGFGKW